METIRIKISGKIYAKAFQEKWLPALSVFVFLSKSHTGKNYYFKKNEKSKLIKSLADKHGFGLTIFRKHIKTLEENGLIKFHENEMRLISKRDMLRMSNKCVFVPGNITSYSEIKTFLNTIPVLSNIVRQEKAIERKQRYSYISEQLSKKFGKITSNDVRKLKKYLSRGGKLMFNNCFCLSVNRIGQVIDRKSKNIITKYKKFLVEKGLIKVFNETKRAFNYKLSFNQYKELKKEGIIESKTYYYKGYVYECKPSVITISYR